MHWLASERIPGLKVGLCPPAHADSRGSFRETWRAEWFPGLTFVQANRSESDAGVLRGLHVHEHQTDAWRCTRGMVRVGLLDLRQQTPVRACFDLPASDNVVLIPPGVAHGYYAIQPSTVEYMVTATYNPADEHALHWMTVSWGDDRGPGPAPALSIRDGRAPELDDFMAEHGAWLRALGGAR